MEIMRLFEDLYARYASYQLWLYVRFEIFCIE